MAADTFLPEFGYRGSTFGVGSLVGFLYIGEGETRCTFKGFGEGKVRVY